MTVSDHLPECPYGKPCDASTVGDGPLDNRHSLSWPCWACGESCICPELRACEERVTAPSHYWDLGYAAGVQDERKRSAMLIADAYGKGLSAAHNAGYAAGVAAAREAVNAALNDRARDLRSCGRDDDCDTWADAVDVALDDALIAIDALRGEQ